MKNSYVSPEIKLENSSNDIVATSSVVETGRIPLYFNSTYSEVQVNTETANIDNFNM